MRPEDDERDDRADAARYGDVPPEPVHPGAWGGLGVVIVGLGLLAAMALAIGVGVFRSRTPKPQLGGAHNAEPGVKMTTEQVYRYLDRLLHDYGFERLAGADSTFSSAVWGPSMTNGATDKAILVRCTKEPCMLVLTMQARETIDGTWADAGVIVNPTAISYVLPASTWLRIGCTQHNMGEVVVEWFQQRPQKKRPWSSNRYAQQEERLFEQIMRKDGGR